MLRMVLAQPPRGRMFWVGGPAMGPSGGGSAGEGRALP